MKTHQIVRVFIGKHISMDRAYKMQLLTCSPGLDSLAVTPEALLPSAVLCCSLPSFGSFLPSSLSLLRAAVLNKLQKFIAV